MKTESISKTYIERMIRKKSFGIISTVSPNGWSQSTGVLFGVSEPLDDFKVYIFTGKSYKKTQNIMNNPHVSFLIPFPHYYFKFAPSSTIQFQSIAKILPLSDQTALHSFTKKRILKSITDLTEEDIEKDDLVFIELTPHKKYNCYGIGFSLLQLAKNPENASYSVEIN